MKCNRCEKKLGRTEPFVVFYARSTMGQKQTFVLCPVCSTGFVDFMKAGKNDKSQSNNDEVQSAKVVETAYINNTTEPKTAQEIVEASSVCPIR